ncbi:unnamed protein product, partial [Owenia fusiformis]
DQITCEEDAKLYMTGPPNGCKSTSYSATNYWISVQKCLPVSKPYDCIDCMCEASGCQKYLGKCTNDQGTWRCGPMWISEAVWNECGKLKGDWKSCARDSVTCSKNCVKNYLNKYRTRCTGKP